MGRLGHMDAAGEPRRLELEVEFEDDPIRGRLYDPYGDGCVERRFSGWLGLMSAIEAVRGASAGPGREQKGEQS